MRYLFGNTILKEKRNIKIDCYILNLGNRCGIELVQTGGESNGCNSILILDNNDEQKVQAFAKFLLDNEVLPVTLVDVLYDYMSY